MKLRDLRAPSALAAALAASACANDVPPPDDRAAPARAVIAAVTPADLGVVAIATADDGAPRLLRAVASSSPTARAAATILAAEPPEAAAIAHARRLAPAWRVGAGAMPALAPAGTIPFAGGHIVRIRQIVDGAEVWGGELRALLGPDNDLRAMSGTMVATDRARRRAVVALDATAAVTAALADHYRTPVAADRVVAVAGARADGSTFFRGARAGAPGVTLEQARARRVWHQGPTGLQSAWMVEAYAAASPDDLDGDAFRVMVATDDGRVLARTNLEAHEAFGYRVFARPDGDLRPLDGPIESFAPHPTGEPDGSRPAYVAPVLVSVDALNAEGDSWLADDATETVGNNADVYVDINSPSGLSEGDFRASLTGANAFDRAFDVAAEPLASQDQQMAAVTQLFYGGNWLHDFWYDAGFTEAAGNAQTDNFGRGGVDGDPLLLEAQDGALAGARNNANMSTPSDGMSPRMQVYLWSGTETRVLEVSGGEPIATTNTASFGPRSFDVTGELVAATDGGEMGAQACNPITSDVAGKIGLVDRGGCTFKTKAANLEAAGAIGMVLANNQDGGAPSMGDSNMPAGSIAIPSLSVTQADGAALRTRLGEGPVTARLQRETGIESDGALDGTLVAHEFGHYLHHRLSVCETAMCGAMSEGWGDFLAVLLAYDEGDDPDGVYPITVYATQGFGADASYFGIRRAPYSTDRTKNALTFRHMADGEALPDHPLAPNGGGNSEVHNAGEVWTAMLWDGYMALQEASDDFRDAQQRMARYVVAGLLMSPPQATVTEVRDAILTAAREASPADHDLLAAAFAGRGAGTCAVDAPRESFDFVGIVEAFDVAGRVDLATPTIADATSCDDDGVLDAGETVRITVPVANGGPTALTDVAVALTSDTPGVTITPVDAAPGTVAAFGAAEATFDVSLADDAEGAIAGDFTVTVTSDGGCEPTVTTAFPLRMNVSDQASASATDAFDADLSVWTIEGDDTGAVWGRFAEAALDRAWRGVDVGGVADAALVSPPLEVHAEDPLTVTFTHRHSFEASDDTLWDGAVIEVSRDGGTTWEDVSMYGATPAYAGTITDQSNNPLGGRDGYGGDSAGYPDVTTETLAFGTALAGETIQLRFRVGTDLAVGAPGWELDDVAFEGILGTPFPTQVADPGACTVDDGPDAGPDDDTPPVDEGGCCSTGGDGPGSALAGLAVLLVALRPRRRARAHQ